MALNNGLLPSAVPTMYRYSVRMSQAHATKYCNKYYVNNNSHNNNNNDNVWRDHHLLFFLKNIFGKNNVSKTKRLYTKLCIKTIFLQLICFILSNPDYPFEAINHSLRHISFNCFLCYLRCIFKLAL